MGWPPRRKKPAGDVGRALGFRSGLEESIQAQLKEAGVKAKYEDLVIPFTPPSKQRRYTPDFELPNGIIVESKGRFVTADRQKHIAVKAEHPDLDIRFVFSNPNTRISKASKTTYAKWCEDHKFLYAAKLVPAKWLQESENKKSLAAIQKLREESLKSPKKGKKP